MRFAYTVSSRRLPGRTTKKVPQPRPCNARRLSHMARFSLIRVRSPLLTESLLFSLPVGTEMFHFPTFPLPALYIQTGVTRSPKRAWLGFPIRTPSDHSSLINSPRLIADCYVLLRLQMPRHPPFALRNLKSHESKNLSTPETRKAPSADRPMICKSVQSTNHDLCDPKPLKRISNLRCSRPLCSSQNTVGTLPSPATPTRKGSEVTGSTRRPARSLRTQQRARTQPPDPNRSRSPKGPY